MALSQAAESFGPTTGIPVIHPGKGGITFVSSVFTQAVMLSAFSMMIAMASEKGMMKSSSIAIVMAATARPRFFHSQASTFNMNGQVAATIMAAQMSDGRNGRMIQKLAAMRIPIHKTCSVIRVKSGAECLCVVISLTLFFHG
jgi:hypothetical protein